MNGKILIMSIMAVVHTAYAHGSFVVGGGVDPSGLSGIVHPIPYTTTATRHGIISDSHHQFVDVNGIVHGGDVGFSGIDGGYINGLAGVNRIVHTTGNVGVDGLIHHHAASSGVVNLNGVVHAVGDGLVDDGSYVHHTVGGGLIDDGSYVHHTVGGGLVDDGSYIHHTAGIPLRSHINGHIVHPFGSAVTTLDGGVHHLVDDGSYVHHQHHQITGHGPAATSSSSSIINVVPNVVTAGGFIRNDIGLVHGGHTIQTVSPGFNVQHQAIVQDTRNDIVTSHLLDNGGNVVHHINSANENHQFSLPAASAAQQFFTADGGVIGHGLVGEAGIIGHGLVGEGGIIGHGLVGNIGVIGHGLVGEGGVISHGIVGNNGIRFIGNTGSAGIIDHGIIGGGQVLLSTPQTSGISVQHHVTGDLTQAQLESLRLPSFQTSLLQQNLEGHTLVTGTGGSIVRGVVNGNVNFVQPTAATVHQRIDLVQPTVVRAGGVSGDQVVSVNFQETGENTKHRIDSANEHFQFTVPTVTNDDSSPSSSPISGSGSFGGVVSGGGVDGSFNADLNLNSNIQSTGSDNTQKTTTLLKGFNRYGVPNA